MPDARRSLSLYRVRDEIEGSRVTSFEQIIRPDILTSTDTDGFDLSFDLDFAAKLFVHSPQPSVPVWLEFLLGGFNGVRLHQTTSSGAVVAVKISQDADEHYFAFTFGTGRHMLRPNAYERNRGLRVALNTMYDPGNNTDQDPARIRSVDARTVATTTMLTRRQTGRPATFEEFGIDVQHDLLGGMTGRPVDQTVWGRRVTGSDAFRFSTAKGFESLGQICRQYLASELENTYQSSFGWIDNVREVNDPALVASLQSELLDYLKQRRGTGIELAPPDIVEWDEVSQFRYPFDDQPRDDLEIGHYLDILQQDGRLDDLTINKLRLGHRIAALDDQGDDFSSWSVYRCLEGEIELDGTTYLITGGTFFEVAPGYQQQLNADIAAIPEYAGALPPSIRGQTEAEYNEGAALGTTANLLLDKRLVRISSATSPIEFCDILTEDRCLIHVKRKARSSSLSHLYAQGSTSADLFLMSPEYRQRALDVVRAVEQEREGTSESPFVGRFSTFSSNMITPSDYEVVYAVIERWKGQDFVDRLPFFSKVNLRRHADDLRRMGFKVSHKRIDIADE